MQVNFLDTQPLDIWLVCQQPYTSSQIRKYERVSDVVDG